MADPPWAPRDKLPGNTRGAARNYRVMSTPEICSFLEAQQIQVADVAILFLWRLSSMQRDALDVASAWGFRDVSEVIWNKLTKTGKPWFGMGRTLRGSHETALVCIRGSADKVVISHSIRTGFPAVVPTYRPGHRDIGRVLLNEEGEPVLDKHGEPKAIEVGDYIHSAKPPEFFTDIVEPLVGTAGPNLELFARERRPGWDAVGDSLPPPGEAGARTGS